jgi:hypothetical protein
MQLLDPKVMDILSTQWEKADPAITLNFDGQQTLGASPSGVCTRPLFNLI